jgi:hypothetical protein
MYEAPKLVRYGQFRDLTLQLYSCPGSQKSTQSFDALFMNGTVVTPSDGCPRS